MMYILLRKDLFFIHTCEIKKNFIFLNHLKKKKKNSCVEVETMSSYYLLPANLHFKKVQTIPVDIQNKLFQNSNGVDAAEKDQNLNIFFYEDTTEIPSTITATVAQVLAADPSDPTVSIPAYRVHVHGWTNTSVSPTGVLTIVGGFPRSFTSNQMVNNGKTSTVLPQGTLTAYLEGLPGDVISPEVVFISNTTVTITDIPTETHPTWAIELDTPYPLAGPSFMEFDFAFYLFTQPQFTYA
jgi:hypothetical protein